MKFNSSKSLFTKIVLFGSILLLIGTSFSVLINESKIEILIILIVNFLTIFLLASIYFQTYYTIENSQILWKSGPFKGKIEIQSITKITKHNGIIVPTTWKPALSHHGLIINYNKYDDIYISPEKTNIFIKELQKINPNILLPTNA